jgi:peptidyl-prolyl cis-trans isomerase C
MASNTQPGKDRPGMAKPRLVLWREPLIHFFILGLAVFGLSGVFHERSDVAEDRFLVEVSSADIEWFRTMWKKRMDREPTVEELRGLINQRIQEEILSREAVSLGLDDGDRVVQRRLAQKMDFLFNGIAEAEEPSEAELKIYLEENRSRYERPGRVDFSQVYFNADQRGQDGAVEAATRLARQLNTKLDDSAAVAVLGDPFLLPSSFSNRSVSEIEREFGPQFAEAVWELAAGDWHASIASGYGVHVVRVHRRSEATMPEFGELRKQLKTDLIAAQRQELAGEAYDMLRARYRVFVEGMPYEMDTGG